MNSTELDWRRVIIDALDQEPSVAAAIERVEQIKRLWREAEAISPTMGTPVVPAVLPEPSRSQRKKRRPSAMGRRPWTEADIEQANRMLALGRSNDAIANVLGRTVKGVEGAIARRLLSKTGEPRVGGRKARATVNGVVLTTSEDVYREIERMQL
jgi:hypothetical protein